MPDAQRAERMAANLAAAARRADPGVEPAAALEHVRLPVHVLHGRYDNLIPYSEGLRLQASLPKETWSTVTITRLFGHSGQSSLRSVVRTLGELPVFLQALRRVLGLV
jgi:pimeloyl-ACP methyl ester carboxylesterase